MAGFTHLHLHTQYSLLDGAIRAGGPVPEGAGARHGVGRGHRPRQHVRRDRLLQEAKAARRQADLRLRDLRRRDRSPRHAPNRRNYHLILLAKNEVGYKNLSYLNSMGYLEGFYYNPRIDKQLLREHSEGLIGLSACLGGEIAQTLETSGVDGGRGGGAGVRRHLRAGRLLPRAAAQRPDAEQEQVNGELQADVARRLGIPLVATDDCHYVNRERRRARTRS